MQKARQNQWLWLALWVGLLSGGCTLLQGARNQVPPPAPVVAPPTPAPGTGPDSVAALELSHKMATLEEERNALVMRVQQLQAILAEKDRQLASANQEIQASAAEVVRAHADLQKWKTEMETLRDKLRSSEKENAATLQSVIGLLEQMVQPEPQTEPRPRPVERREGNND